MAQTVFERTEKKYRITCEQRKKLCEELSAHMQEDTYGRHTVCSVYYDDEIYGLIRWSIQKPIYKEKLRLRCYGIPTPESHVFVELKKKFDGVVYKRRIEMTLREAEAYLNEGVLPEKRGQIFEEIEYFRNYYSPKPRALVAYDRVALVCEKHPDLRITFDENIRCRTTELSLSSGVHGQSILPPDECIMEIKALGGLPLWLCEILTHMKIYPSSFSKYGTYYQNIITKGAAD